MENKKQLKTKKEQTLAKQHPVDKLTQVREWMETQPLSNPVEAAENIFEYLRNIQEKSFSTEEQFEILELLEPVLKYLWHSLRKLYLGTTNTPYREKGHIIFICNGLEYTASNIYAMLVAVLTKTAIITHHKPFHALLIYRTMYHLIHVLISHYQLSCKPPEKIWQKFHKLYLHAERYQLLNIEINTELTAAGSKTTLDTLYKHALLLSTCNPFKLRYYEIEKVHQALFSWASLVLLSSELENPLFTVNLEKDYPPHYTEMVTATDREKILGLDTYLLSEHMDDILEQRADIELTVRILEMLSKSLIEHLRSVWQHSYVRRFPRVEATGRMMVCIGLKTGYALFSAVGSFDIVSESAAIRSEDIIVEDAPNEEHATKHLIYEWVVSNLAPEGFCLVTTGQEKELLQPGEMVILKNCATESDLPWQLGLVRWVMREEDKDNLKIGVETLSSNARAVIATVHELANNPLQAIVFPSFDKINHHFSVILPPNSAQQGDLLHIESDILEYDIKLDEPILQNDTLSLFPAMIHTIIREDPTLLHGKSGSEFPNKSGDSIWNEI